MMPTVGEALLTLELANDPVCTRAKEDLLRELNKIPCSVTATRALLSLCRKATNK